MRVFELGDQLGLPFELADEVGVVGQTRVDDLDRDLATELGLKGAIDRAEGTAADPLAELVPAHPAADRIQLGILLKDLSLEALEFGRWLDAKLLGQHRSGAEVGLQRVPLATRAVQGDHELAPVALA